MIEELPDDGLSEERIRVRAYEIFLRRGGQGGTPESDWLLAREELIKEAAAASPAPPKARGGAGKTAATEAAPAPEPAAAPPKRSVRNVRPNTASRRSR
jgi:hypothetical protein